MATARTKGRVLTMESGGQQLLERKLTHRFVTGINGNAIGNTTVFTTDANLGLFCVVEWVIIATSIVGLTLLPTISLGYTAANYDQISAALQLSANGTNKYEVRVPGDIEATGSNLVAVSTAVVARVNPAGTGTTCTLRIDARGFYLS